MKKRAKRPLNHAAIGKANDAFYTAHPELVAEDGTRLPLAAGKGYRSEWMILYEQSGGEVEEPPAIRQRPADPVVRCPDHRVMLALVTDDGYPIPHAAFRIVCEDGVTKNGILGRDGRLSVGGLPPSTPFAVYYPDEDDVRAKAFAARMDDGLSQASPEVVLGVLMQPASDLRAVANLFDRYYEGPLEQRCREIFKGHECLPVVENLLARAGLYKELVLIEYGEGR